MTSREINGFKEYKINETHFHPVYPIRLSETVEIMNRLFDYFEWRSVTVQTLHNSGHRLYDPVCNLKSLYLKSLFADENRRVYVYGNALLPGGPDDPDYYFDQVEKLYRMGVDGYKMLEGKPAYRRDLGRSLSDPVFDKMYSFIEKKGMPLKIHMCDPRKYWGPRETMTPTAIARGWWYGDGTFPSFDSIWGELEDVLDRFPNMKLCVAHFGYISDDIERCKRAFERWKNFSFDFTPGAATFDSFTKKPDEWRDFVEKYSDRLYFGTDTYNRFEESSEEQLKGIYEQTGGRYRLVRAMLEYSPDVKVNQSGFDPFTPISVSQKTLDNIYVNNVDRLLGDGRALDSLLILSEAERIRDEYLSGKYSYIDEYEQKLELDNLEVMISYFKSKI